MMADHIAMARHRLLHVDPALRPLFEKLVGLVEQAAATLGPLERLHQSSPLGGGAGWGASLGDFIENDVLCILDGMATDLPRLIPADPHWADEADPAEMHVDAELLVRNLAVACMAASDPGVPPPLRGVLLEADHRLAGWELEIAGVLRRIDDRILRPLLTDPP